MTKNDFLELMNVAFPWAHFLAQDWQGAWCLYQEEPEIDGDMDEWEAPGEIFVIDVDTSILWAGDWKNSLTVLRK